MYTIGIVGRALGGVGSVLPVLSNWVGLRGHTFWDGFAAITQRLCRRSVRMDGWVGWVNVYAFLQHERLTSLLWKMGFVQSWSVCMPFGEWFSLYVAFRQSMYRVLSLCSPPPPLLPFSIHLTVPISSLSLYIHSSTPRSIDPRKPPPPYPSDKTSTVPSSPHTAASPILPIPVPESSMLSLALSHTPPSSSPFPPSLASALQTQGAMVVLLRGVQVKSHVRLIRRCSL